MMTPWTRALLDDARELILAGRYRSALDCVLTVLSVYPALAEAQELAATIVYHGSRQSPVEPLTRQDMWDTRLDELFCSCDARGCTAAWMSIGRFMPGNVAVANPIGGRCEACDQYFCRNHFGRRNGCPRCRRALDHAPQVSNGRPSGQMVRLNQPLVHVQVLREGTGVVSPEYMTDLLSWVAPDVFEDSPTIRALSIHPWPDNPDDRAMMQVIVEHDEFGEDTHDLRVSNGHSKDGSRWAIVKVFAKMPKYVDPDFPS
ncbi:hypothetical protein [Lentzea terrae]|uniref:hypothetical protein n=1 Tax=Lentzea terrae TaxID=2200761 RepID=UPI0018E54E94|nr:hypothetical protein [Lentzea terrae]